MCPNHSLLIAHRWNRMCLSEVDHGTHHDRHIYAERVLIVDALHSDDV